MSAPTISIVKAAGAADIADAAALVREYIASLPFALDYQDIEAELARFPAGYRPPGGALWLARAGDGGALGMIALKALSDETGEMKRLYVRPAGRGGGLGRGLIETLIDEGRRIGYRAIRLDTIAGLQDAAIALYRAAGFVEIAPYYDSPIPGTLYLEYRYAARISSSRA